MIDTLAAFLEGPRARSAFTVRSIMTSPWSLGIRDEAALTLVAVVRGDAWIVAGDVEPQWLTAGDLAIVRGPQPYTVADRPETEPTVLIMPGQVCMTPDGRSLTESMTLGVRTWGNDPNGDTTMLTGTYNSDCEVGRRLLDSLPRTIVLRSDDWRSPLIAVLTDEISNDAPGQSVVLDRLLDLILINALRAWFARPDHRAPAWYHVHADPVVGRALRLLHEDPAHQWSVGELAARVGLSRAALARRFNDLVGQPPMQYLAEWRLALAADHLRTADATVTSVARQVGYSSPFTFSTAFKRAYGVSPSSHRAIALAG